MVANTGILPFDYCQQIDYYVHVNITLIQIRSHQLIDYINENYFDIQQGSTDKNVDEFMYFRAAMISQVAD